MVSTPGLTLRKQPILQPTSNLPRLGFCLPAKIFSAVDLPIPFVPTKPRTSPGLGIGNLQQREKVILFSDYYQSWKDRHFTYYFYKMSLYDVIVSKGLSRQEKKERKHKERDLCWSQPLPLTTCVVETYRFSKLVSSNVECAYPVETAH